MSRKHSKEETERLKTVLKSMKGDLDSAVSAVAVLSEHVAQLESQARNSGSFNQSIAPSTSSSAVGFLCSKTIFLNFFVYVFFFTAAKESSACHSCSHH